MASRPSIFDFPQLVELVSEHLSTHDIAKCMATSKALARRFEPFLWRDVTRPRSPLPQSVARNRHQIRSLSLDWFNPSVYFFADGLSDLTPGSPMNNPVFCQLRVVKFTGSGPFFPLQLQHRLECLDCIQRILSQSPNLTHITLPRDFIARPLPLVQDFLRILDKLPRVQELRIQGSSLFSDTQIEPEVGFELVRVCFSHPVLANLYCNFEVGFKFRRNHQRVLPDYGPQFDSFLAALEEDRKESISSGKLATGARIKELQLPEITARYPFALICTLLKSYLPNIERFHIPRITTGGHHASYQDSLKKVIAQGCPKLQHISCVLNDASINTGVIMGCKEWGLRSFYDHELTPKIHGYILKTLLVYHSETLEEARLTGYLKGCRRELADFLSECKNLKMLLIQDLSGAIKLRHLVSREWVCHDLKALRLIMDRRDHQQGTASSDDSDNEDVEERRKIRTAKAYDQIGRLIKLEILCVSGGQGLDSDLTLSHGWLSKLAQLKKLKHFTMATDLWSRIGQAEVEFMDAQWPRLEKISFGSLPVSMSLGNTTKAPHWQWLQKRRPYLKYDME